MKSKRIKLNVFTALMIAMSVVLGRCFLIPIFWTRGNINSVSYTHLTLPTNREV